MDVFKGLAISLIAILHISIVARSGMSEPSPFLQALYLGLVGFFIMSGYFFRPERGFRENMRCRVKVLFIGLVAAAFILPIISFIWCSIWGQPTGFEDLVDCWIRTFAVERTMVPFDERLPWAICGFSMGYYFLWSILGAFIIFYAVADRIRDDIRLGLVTILVLVTITAVYRELCDFSLPFYLNLSPIAAAFMICGMYLARIDFVSRIESGDMKDPRWWAPFIGCTAVLLVMVFILPPSITFDLMNFGKYGGLSAFPYMIEGMLAFVMIIYLSFFVSKIPFVSVLFSRIGEHTMGILLLHVFIAKIALAPFFTFNTVDCITGDFQAGIGRTLFSVAALLTAYLICHMVSRIRIQNDVPHIDDQ